MKPGKFTSRLVFAAAASVLASSATAAVQAISTVPTSWRLESYSNDESVVVWFSPSVCSSGKLTLPAGASQALRNRFAAVIIAGKAAGKKVVVYYDDSTAPGTCTILSFGLEAE